MGVGMRLFGRDDAYTMGTCSFSGRDRQGRGHETAIACNGSNTVLRVTGRLEHGYVMWKKERRKTHEV
jgi:hypothetical protein